MDDIIFQYPFDFNYYEIVINKLLQLKMYDKALPYLVKYDKLTPTIFASKWLGIIELSRNNTSEAIRYFEKSNNLYSFDSQVYFNLAKAYTIKKDYSKALSAIDNCLMINPNYEGARAIQGKLLRSLQK